MNELKHYRQKSGLTQSDVAEVLGIRQSTVAMWETGEALPRADKLPKLAELFNCSIDELLVGNMKNTDEIG